MTKYYCGESIVDIEQDVYECLDDLPVDENNMITGDIKIEVTYIP